jgi:hypothetical protein
VTLSLAIDTTTEQNGALKFVTGSGVARALRPFRPAGKSRAPHSDAIEVANMMRAKAAAK